MTAFYDDVLYACPECGTQAYGKDDIVPGHLHDIESESPTFVQYVPVEPEPAPPARTRRKAG
jgi:hypothetical protein